MSSNQLPQPAGQAGLNVPQPPSLRSPVSEPAKVQRSPSSCLVLPETHEQRQGLAHRRVQYLALVLAVPVDRTGAEGVVEDNWLRLKVIRLPDRWCAVDKGQDIV